MNKLLLLLMLASMIWSSEAQSPKDSVQIMKANWSPGEVRKGVVHKHAPFKFLFGAPQNIHVIEVTPARRQCGLNFLINEPSRTMSESVKSVGAIAAINGTLKEKEKDHPACFVKLGPDVIATTAYSKLGNRITGALCIDQKGKVSLIAWNEEIEKGWSDQKSLVMASGPLLLQGGEMKDFAACDSLLIYNRHPRSAIGITNEGKLLLVTVDGALWPHAAGMSIPELAYFMKIMGCVDALNLAGGEATTLWVSRGKGGVVNMPSGNGVFDHHGEQPLVSVLYIK